MNGDGSFERKGPLKLLVDPDSATCRMVQGSPEKTIPINRSHSEMVKFRSDDIELDTILSKIRDICDLDGHQEPHSKLAPPPPNLLPAIADDTSEESVDYQAFLKSV